MNPAVIAAAATTASTIIGFKGNQASAKAARQTAEYNAQLAENEAVVLQRAKIDQEANLRRTNERLTGQQVVATAASGVEVSGSPYLALADSYFAMERDALRIQYASDVETAGQLAQAAMARAAGNARASAFRTAAYTTLLDGAGQAASIRQQQDFFDLQDRYRQQELDR
tara:strand:+ start:87 stop:596 length:510 start_codon:yes stop_codon:yes gene_type:complete